MGFGMGNLVDPGFNIGGAGKNQQVTQLLNELQQHVSGGGSGLSQSELSQLKTIIQLLNQVLRDGKVSAGELKLLGSIMGQLKNMFGSLETGNFEVDTLLDQVNDLLQNQSPDPGAPVSGSGGGPLSVNAVGFGNDLGFGNSLFMTLNEGDEFTELLRKLMETSIPAVLQQAMNDLMGSSFTTDPTEIAEDAADQLTIRPENLV